MRRFEDAWYKKITLMKGKEMDQKEKFDALMRQAEFNIKRFDERRGYSWKVALGFWGAILGTAAVFGDLKPSLFFLCLLPGTLIPIILHSFWLVNVFNANKIDKVAAFEARDAAYKHAKLKYEKPEHKPKPYYEDWSVQFQFAVTVILSFGGIFYVVLSILK